jgi:Flp pilus assembly protein TadD
MSDYRRVRKQRAIQQAEGYLELNMPRHALEVLDRNHLRSNLAGREAYLRGEALRSLERYEEAIEPLSRAAEDYSENVSVWLALGWCFKRTGELDRAMQSLRRALEVEPEEALLHYNLACYLSLANRKDEAIEYLAKALALDEGYRKLIDGERDFDPIRSDPDFQSLVKAPV